MVGIERPMPVEDFRELPGWTGYIVGKDGSVWSARRKDVVTDRWHKLSPSHHGNGYLRVILFAGQRRRNRMFVHHLVLQTFVGPRPVGAQACHRNDVSTDNRLENLYWASPKQNSADRYLNGGQRRGSNVAVSKLREADIPAIFHLVKSGRTKAEVGTMFGVSDVVIGNIINGKSWRHASKELTNDSEAGGSSQRDSGAVGVPLQAADDSGVDDGDGDEIDEWIDSPSACS